MILEYFSRFYKPFSGLPHAVWLLSIVSLINRSGAMVVCFISLYLTTELHYDLRSAGYVMSMFGLGAIVGAWLGGWLTDTFGYYRVQWTTLILSGFLLIVALNIRDFWSLSAVLFALNVFTEAFRPANSVAIGLHSTEETRTRSYSLMRMAVNLAIAIALSVGGLLVSIGWAWLFVGDALTCFLAAGMVLFGLKEHKNPVKETKNSPTAETLATASPYRDGLFLLFCVATFLGAFVFMQLIWTVPNFFKLSYGWSESTIGFVSAFNGIVVMCVELPLIFRIEQKKPKMWFVQWGVVLYAASYLLFVIPPIAGMIAALAFMFLLSFGEIFVMPFSTTWAIARAGDQKQGQYMALYGMAYAVANISAPFIGTQVVAAYGFTALWWLSAVVCLVACLIFGYIGRQKETY